MNLNLCTGVISRLLFSTLILAFAATGCNQKKSDRPLDPRVAKLELQDGFTADHIYSPSDNGQGSWVSMTFDNKGRMIASDQNGALYRLELPPIGSDSSVQVKVEKLEMPKLEDVKEGDLQIGHAQGLLYAFNSLYVVVNHRANDKLARGSGLYRLQDTDGDDQYDRITLLKEMNGQGEHGPHSVIIGPDSVSLYVVAGNHTDLPEMDEYLLPKVWQTDNLFPEIKDPRGHANDRGVPGGWIARTDSAGAHWELISAGYRNAYDITFNEHGDLFAYDSDMEWDFGLPWYRPTRIYHATSGSEFGWRTGNGKLGSSYPDVLPPALDIGPGSPTNFLHARNARFPEKYRKALFAFDWSFGIVYNIFLEPKGASYEATQEEFLSGIPLPLTDGMIGPDGALYFLTGGRGLQSDLYRVYYTGKEDVDSELSFPDPTPENQLRRKLEAYHREVGQEAIDFAWQHLKHPDRFVRYAARIAVEHQPRNLWQNKALAERDPDIQAEALLALARHSDASQRDQLISTLLNTDLSELNEAQQLRFLRAYEIILYRMGQPAGGVKTQLISALDPLYPAASTLLNKELSKILAFLEAPGVIEKTLALLEKAESGEDTEAMTGISDKIMRNPQYGLDLAGMLEKVPPGGQIYYATVLSRVKSGWTPALREQYFKWFEEAFGYQGGRSYVGFIDKARQMALANVPADRKAYYAGISGDSLLNKSGNDLVNIKGPEGPGRRWTVDEATAAVEGKLTGRDFERGRNMYLATSCNRCHTMQGEGASTGPDLTQLGTRFTPRDILEAIIEPSKVISDQYGATVLQLKNGKSIVGRIMNETSQAYMVSQNPFVPDAIEEVPKSEVVSTKPSTVSVMLPGLINSLNEEELRDLMAYLVSGGNKDHEVFQGAPVASAE